MPGGTGIGGNSEVGFVGIEVFDEDAFQDPSIPDPTVDIRTVDFVITRNTSNENSLVLTKDGPGFGPDTITFGPTSGTISIDIGENTVYNLTGENTNTSDINVKLSENTLFVDDQIGSGPDPTKSVYADGDYNDLTVTPSRGKFTKIGSKFTWNANWEYPPFQVKPAAPTEPAEEDVRRVTFTISKSTSFTNRLVYRKNSLPAGTGPNEIILSNTKSSVSVDVGENVTYDLFSSTTDSTGIDIKLSGNCLFIDDDQGNTFLGYDNDYDDMIITPGLGKFNSAFGWEADWSVSTTTTPTPPSETLCSLS